MGNRLTAGVLRDTPSEADSEGIAMARRPLTRNTWRKLIADAGLSQVRSATTFGYSGRVGQYWAKDPTGATTEGMAVPLAVEICIRLMAKHGFTDPEQLLDL
jgi:hypothetical protein